MLSGSHDADQKIVDNQKDRLLMSCEIKLSISTNAAGEISCKFTNTSLESKQHEKEVYHAAMLALRHTLQHFADAHNLALEKPHHD
jgi:hypothetical protein